MRLYGQPQLQNTAVALSFLGTTINGRGTEQQCSAMHGSPHKLRKFRELTTTKRDSTSTQHIALPIDPSQTHQNVQNRADDNVQALGRFCNQRGNPKILDPESGCCQSTFLNRFLLHVRVAITSPSSNTHAQCRGRLIILAFLRRRLFLSDSMAVGYDVMRLQITPACAVTHVQQLKPSGHRRVAKRMKIP